MRTLRVPDIVPHVPRTAKKYCYNSSMTKSDWLLFILTFLVGASMGAFLYVTSFKPVYQPEGLSRDEVAASNFSVTGRSYGGMRAGYVHPTFRITGDGAYEYVPGGVGIDAGMEPVAGMLPREVFRDVERAIAEADLPRLTKPAAKEYCNIYTDGVDYTYRITIEKAQYEVDTCATALTYDHDLAQALQNVWAYLEGESYETSGEGSGGGFIEAWLTEQFKALHEEEGDPDQPPEPVACTMDAKICPDGSAVGRVPPSCNFAPCPGE